MHVIGVWNAANDRVAHACAEKYAPPIISGHVLLAASAHPRVIMSGHVRL